MKHAQFSTPALDPIAVPPTLVRIVPTAQLTPFTIEVIRWTMFPAGQGSEKLQHEIPGVRQT